MILNIRQCIRSDKTVIVASNVDEARLTMAPQCFPLDEQYWLSTALSCMFAGPKQPTKYGCHEVAWYEIHEVVFSELESYELNRFPLHPSRSQGVKSTFSEFFSSHLV